MVIYGVFWSILNLRGLSSGVDDVDNINKLYDRISAQHNSELERTVRCSEVLRAAQIHAQRVRSYGIIWLVLK
jgi:hypothetical protein